MHSTPLSALALWLSLALVSAAAAQNAKAPPTPAGQPALPGAAPAAPAGGLTSPEPAEPPPQPYRTEILAIDSWTVTCQDFLQPKPRHMCAAQLRIIRQGSTQVIVVLNVLVDEAGHPHLTVTTPTGVSIAKGVELVVAGGLARKLAFDTCDANQCTASTPLDDKLAKDLQTGASADVTITAINGAAVKVGFAVKGFDKALPAMGIKM